MNELLNLTAIEAAPRLLGSYFIRELNGRRLIGKIVETEAYHQDDPASHTFWGPTARNKVMYGPAGFLYVYFTYGMHYCMNVVVGAAEQGEAVLIRALEPLEGIAYMQANRNGRNLLDLTNGPAKACQALKIDKSLNGHDLSLPPVQLELREPVTQGEVVQTTRIGISTNQEAPWRFYIRGNSFVSKV